MTQQPTSNEILKMAARRRSHRVTAKCLSDEQAIAFYCDQVNDQEAEMIREHLAVCWTCRDLARLASTFLHATGQPIPAHTAPVQAAVVTPTWFIRRRKVLFLVVATVIAAVGLGLLLARGWHVEAPTEEGNTMSAPEFALPQLVENPWSDLEIARAEYMPANEEPTDLIWRDDEAEAQQSRHLESFLQAMEPYQRGDVAEAERRLSRAVVRHPDHAEAQFYLGVSLLLLGRTADAIAPLETASGIGHGRLKEEARWYLALAHLKSGEPAKASHYLDLTVASGKHVAEAEALRRQIRQSPPVRRD